KRYLSNVSTTESDKALGRYSCTATYNYEFKKKTRTVQISYELKYLEDQKKAQASASDQPVKTDYFIADAGGWGAPNSERKKATPSQSQGWSDKTIVVRGHQAHHPGLGLSISTRTTSTAVQLPYRLRSCQ